MYAAFINWLSATPLGSWLVKHVASRLDPVIFRVTNGRWTSTGVPTLPMLTLTTIGRRSGRPHTIQLAFHAEGDDYLVVASAMGQQAHPAWKYNLDAHPEVQVRVRGATFAARATRLSDDDKARVWPAIKRTIPQLNVYERRTARDIRVFRIRRI